MLQQQGECYVYIPERVFDADYPGHYMRRLKSVSLEIPCVAGPYTSINCRLTLLGNNKIRISDKLGRNNSYTDGELFGLQSRLISVLRDDDALGEQTELQGEFHIGQKEKDGRLGELNRAICTYASDQVLTPGAWQLAVRHEDNEVRRPGVLLTDAMEAGRARLDHDKIQDIIILVDYEVVVS